MAAANAAKVIMAARFTDMASLSAAAAAGWSADVVKIRRAPNLPLDGPSYLSRRGDLALPAR